MQRAERLVEVVKERRNGLLHVVVRERRAGARMQCAQRAIDAAAAHERREHRPREDVPHVQRDVIDQHTRHVRLRALDRAEGAPKRVQNAIVRLVHAHTQQQLAARTVESEPHVVRRHVAKHARIEVDARTAEQVRLAVQRAGPHRRRDPLRRRAVDVDHLVPARHARVVERARLAESRAARITERHERIEPRHVEHGQLGLHDLDREHHRARDVGRRAAQALRLRIGLHAAIQRIEQLPRRLHIVEDDARVRLQHRRTHSAPHLLLRRQHGLLRTHDPQRGVRRRLRQRRRAHIEHVPIGHQVAVQGDVPLVDTR